MCIFTFSYVYYIMGKGFVNGEKWKIFVYRGKIIACFS